MTPLIRSLAAVAALTLCASGAAAQIDAENPFNTGGTVLVAPGDMFEVLGEGLPDKKVKARLIDPDTGSRVKGSSVKFEGIVSKGDDDLLTFSLRKGCAGSYQVEIRGKDFEPAITPSNDGGTVLILVGPTFQIISTPADMETARYVPGEDIVMTVGRPGRKKNGDVIKPKLTVGGKRAKVGKPGPYDEETGRADVPARLPKKLGTGTWGHETKTKAGTDFATGSTRPIPVTNDNEKQNRIKDKGFKLRYQLVDTTLFNPGKKTRKLNIGRKQTTRTVDSKDGETLVAGSKGQNNKARAVDATLPTDSSLVEDLSFTLDGGPDEGFLITIGSDVFGDDDGAVTVLQVNAVSEGIVSASVRSVTRREDAEGDPIDTEPRNLRTTGTITFEQSSDS